MKPEVRDRVLAFTRPWLTRVSRSFAPSIALLGEDAEPVVGVAYLLCRMADTFEDSDVVSVEVRCALLNSFCEALCEGASHTHFVDQAKRAFGHLDDDESKLVRESASVLDLFHTALATRERDVLRRWVSEMARGMISYVARSTKMPVVLADLADLEQYCYYVAGTVGGLLTDLFELYEPEIDSGRALALRERAASFGRGLQLVNIVKDLAKDHLRGWQFLPQQMCNFDPADLLNPERQDRVLSAHAALCSHAQSDLREALSYTLHLPPTSSARRFCAFPLLMARATLRDVAGNPAVLLADTPVKIARTEAEQIFGFVLTQIADDAALTNCYEELGSRVIGPQANSR